jgi:competence protein ComEC
MFDVGQAESMLLRLPDGRSVVIDAGGSATGAFDIGARVLAPALWASGVFRLDALLVTHGDPDHIGGARSLVADFRPAQVWTGVPVENHAPETVLRQEAARRGVAMASLFRGQSWRWGEVSVRVLHPGQPDWERRRVRNDDSIVVEVVYRDVAILLTGDISSAVEREILPMLTPARVRVLKVAHHGSRTSSSSDLIAGWKPHIALVSCGRGNQFGHPVREVLERLDTVGASMFRTDRHGQIRLTTDGARVDVLTYVERMSGASANAGY